MREANPKDVIGQLQHNMWVHQCHGRGAANREFAGSLEQKVRSLIARLLAAPEIFNRLRQLRPQFPVCLGTGNPSKPKQGMDTNYEIYSEFESKRPLFVCTLVLAPVERNLFSLTVLQSGYWPEPPTRRTKSGHQKKPRPQRMAVQPGTIWVEAMET